VSLWALWWEKCSSQHHLWSGGSGSGRSYPERDTKKVIAATNCAASIRSLSARRTVTKFTEYQIPNSELWTHNTHTHRTHPTPSTILFKIQKKKLHTLHHSGAER